MKTGISWRQALTNAAVSGSFASLASTVALARAGHADCRHTFAPVNAISHWIWNEPAIYQDEASLRHSLVGYLIHHSMSVFWAALYEKRFGHYSEQGRAGPALAAGLAVAALAALVDLRCTPRRLTPGFERRLSRRSLVWVYAAFGVALAARCLDGPRRRR